jgi:hypothetical protein
MSAKPSPLIRPRRPRRDLLRKEALRIQEEAQVGNQNSTSEKGPCSGADHQDQPVDPSRAQAGAGHQDGLEKLKFIRGEMKHEFSLLAGRVNAYLTCQSFLVVAYALSMGNVNPEWGALFRLIFPAALSCIGIATSIHAYFGIRGASYTIELWRNKLERLVASGDMEDYHVRRPIIEDRHRAVDMIHRQSLLFAEWSPWVFAFSWCLFGLLALFLNLPSALGH